MTPRVDSRVKETDSAPETYRSNVSCVQGIEETAFNNHTVPDKSPKSAENGYAKDSKVGKLILGEICEECDTDKMEKFRSRMQYSRSQDTAMKMAFPKSPRKFEDTSLLRDRESTNSNKNTAYPQKNFKSRMALPKIT